MVYKSQDQAIIKKLFLIHTYNKLNFRHLIVFNKNACIPNSFKTFQLKIHKGHIFRTLFVDKFIVGLRFGTFVFTRKPHTFIKKKKTAANLVKR